MKKTFLFGLVFFAAFQLHAQKVGYIASQVIRERWQDMQQAQQRIQSMVDDWKREIATMQKQIEEMELDFKKNRLIWSAEERQEKEELLKKKRLEREDFAKKKFEPNGEYDQQATAILKPVEEKLFTVVQEVSASEGYDIVLDKTTMPIPYVNPKYDLTVKVLKKLNIPADDLEEKQKKAIEDDPRNKKDTKKDEPQLPRKRSRTTDSEEKKTDTKTDTPATDIPR